MQIQYDIEDNNESILRESLSVEQIMFESSLEMLEDSIFREYDDMFERLSK